MGISLAALSNSDIIAIVIGVVNTLVGVFGIIQVWRCYRRRRAYLRGRAHKRHKVARRRFRFKPQATGDVPRTAPQPPLDDNKTLHRCRHQVGDPDPTFKCCNQTDTTKSTLDPPPPYPPILLQMPPAAKLKPGT